MNRFQQNLLYLAVIGVVFVVFYILFPKNNKFYPRGVFLPTYNVDMPAIDPSKVKVYDLRYKSDTEGAIGSIRVITHVKSEDEFDNACEQSIKKAVKIAAENGADEIKYACLYPKEELNELSGIRLEAYAFRS